MFHREPRHPNQHSSSPSWSMFALLSETSLISVLTFVSWSKLVFFGVFHVFWGGKTMKNPQRFQENGPFFKSNPSTKGHSCVVATIKARQFFAGWCLLFNKVLDRNLSFFQHLGKKNKYWVPHSSNISDNKPKISYKIPGFFPAQK